MGFGGSGNDAEDGGGDGEERYISEVVDSGGAGDDSGSSCGGGGEEGEEMKPEGKGLGRTTQPAPMLQCEEILTLWDTLERTPKTL